MKKLSIVLMLILADLTGYGQNKDFKMSNIFPVEASHSYVGFSVEYMGYAKVRGRFANFQGTVFYDENDIKRTSASFSIDVKSIDTDLDWRDKDLKSANWFDAEKFPKIYFTSKEVKLNNEGFKLIGDVTIKGITKEVVLNMDKPSGVLSDTRGDSQVIFTGEVSINRKDYGVEGKNWSKVKEGLTAVGNDINIELSILGKKINKDNLRNWVRNPSRPPGMVYQMVNEKGAQETIREFDKLRSQPDSKLNSGALKIAGYMLIKEERYEEALQLFEANVKAFPEEADVYDSYAGALATTGQFEEAVKYYEIALKKDPENQNAKEILRHLKF